MHILHKPEELRFSSLPPKIKKKDNSYVKDKHTEKELVWASLLLRLSSLFYFNTLFFPGLPTNIWLADSLNVPFKLTWYQLIGYKRDIDLPLKF